MHGKGKIEVALAAADQPVMVESAAQLQQAVEACLDCEVIGIDTEFVRERTWRADLGLVQLSDGRKVWLVDPLKTGSLLPLGVLLQNQATLKVLHAPSEDLGVLLAASEQVPKPLFDTQIACAMVGQTLQMGYHKTVEWLLNIKIDKGETRSNWCKRPLRRAQLRYAALDVCLLPLMYQQLSARLQELGREHWLVEDGARMLQKAQHSTDPQQAWQRISGISRLNGVSLAILQILASWRDRQAEHRNLARGFVIKDMELLKIAQLQPTQLDALAGLDVLHPRAVQRYGKTLIARIEQVLQEGLQLTPPAILESSQRPLLASMRKLVQAEAAQLEVEPALLASRKELEKLLLLPPTAPLPERFAGWRKDIITDQLLALKQTTR